MQNPSFTIAVDHLTQNQNPRVWSLLISVFGDLAQKEGASLSGALLRQLNEKIGIRPEAMRVAIHRLRKEGWIESHRNGRTSAYFLTPWGRAQSAQASPRIYATGPAADQAWLALLDPARPSQSSDATGVWVASNILITSLEPTAEQAFVSRLQPRTPVPEWISAKVCDDPTRHMAQDFAAALDQVTRDLTPAPALCPLEVAALRVLLVHGWRRIILKTPLLPDHVFPQAWSGPECRAMVGALLAHYPPPDLHALEIRVTSGKAALSK